MNKKLIIAGLLMAFLWFCAANLTRGFSYQTADFLNNLSGYHFSEQIDKTVNGFYYEINNSEMPTEIFLAVFFVIFVIYLVIIALIQKSSLQKYSIGIIIFFAVLFRVVMLPTEPVHENDFYRYIWDGKSTIHGINPFKYAPSDLYMYENRMTEDFYDPYYDVMLKGRNFDGTDIKEIETLIEQKEASPVFYHRIGHWQVPTIYPPVAQLIFGAIMAVNQHSIFWMKLVFVLFDLAVILILLQLLRLLNLNPALSLIYAWSPLVVKEIANSGHYDSIPIFFMMAAVLFAVKGRGLTAAAKLALATLSKFFALLLYPVLMRPFRVKDLCLFSGICVGLYVPFFLWNQTGVAQVFEGLNTYNSDWSYNSSIFAGVYHLLGALSPKFTDSLIPAKVLCGILLGGVVLKTALSQMSTSMDKIKGCFTVIAALFLINPVGDPWYYCWLVPFLCFLPRGSWILLSGLLMVSYLNFQSELLITQVNLGGIPLLSWIIYLPFAGYFLFEKIRRRGSAEI